RPELERDLFRETEARHTRLLMSSIRSSKIALRTWRELENVRRIGQVRLNYKFNALLGKSGHRLTERHTLVIEASYAVRVSVLVSISRAFAHTKSSAIHHSTFTTEISRRYQCVEPLRSS